jgi:hypothetical protein
MIGKTGAIGEGRECGIIDRGAGLIDQRGAVTKSLEIVPEHYHRPAEEDTHAGGTGPATSIMGTLQSMALYRILGASGREDK